jgi:Na+-translocating ferredoxin:NAD+ oxidoreductase RNF subunit RnfB
MGYSNGVSRTGFSAVIDQERCNGCGACLRACNVKAITRNDACRETVVGDVCLGCGACISSCRQGALSMVWADNRELPPLKRKDLYLRILKEKRRLTPFVVSEIKKSLRSLLTGRPGNTVIPIIKE